tara:strand:- start:956 stop:1183 length:228 start_codon:yes stop_codon:yes gene_type:complete
MLKSKIDKTEIKLKISHTRSHVYGDLEFETIGAFRKAYNKALRQGDTITCYRFMAENWYRINSSYIESLLAGHQI